jgi:Double-GTPase 2
MTSELPHSCGQEQCNVRETGSCLEGIALEDCPHYQLASEAEEADGRGIEDNEGAAEANEIDLTGTLVRELPHGDALTLTEAGVVSGAGPSRLIVLAGDRDCGKTTLITSLYESFLTGEFCDSRFAGSMTLPGFEQRAFLARLDSGVEIADTPRTSAAASLLVLHLCLVTADPDSRRLHMLLGDLSGERYRLSRESQADARELRFLRYTDRLCLLIDGEKIASPRERIGAIDEAQGTLRSLLEAGVLGDKSRIDVVCSKWDLLQDDDRAAEFVEGGFADVREAFENEVLELHFGRIAARPAQVTKDIPHGFGLDALLRRWISPKVSPDRIESPLPPARDTERECGRFARRYPVKEPK